MWGHRKVARRPLAGNRSPPFQKYKGLYFLQPERDPSQASARHVLSL